MLGLRALQQILQLAPFIARYNGMDKVVPFDKNLYALFIKQLVFYLMDGAINFEVDVHVANLWKNPGLPDVPLRRTHRALPCADIFNPFRVSYFVIEPS